MVYYCGMLKTYRAILTNDRLRWVNEAPPVSSPAKVDVIVVEDASANGAGRGRKMAEALAKLAARGGLSIDDPIAWQRQQREDRPLPGR